MNDTREKRIAAAQGQAGPREPAAERRPECSTVAWPGRGQAQLLEGVPVCAGCASEAGGWKLFSLHFFDFSLSVSKVGC